MENYEELREWARLHEASPDEWEVDDSKEYLKERIYSLEDKLDIALEKLDCISSRIRIFSIGYQRNVDTIEGYLKSTLKDYDLLVQDILTIIKGE